MSQWNELAELFAGNTELDSIPGYAADNICIAWPSIFTALQTLFANKQQLSILDYGCGGGLLCRQLHAMGHKVSGYDSASEMIRNARKIVPADVYLSDSVDMIESGKNYDVIIAVMVFQFIADIETCMANLRRALKPGGTIISVVFNPAFIDSNATKPGLFSNVVKSSGNNGHAIMELKAGSHIPVYIRDADYYRGLLSQHTMNEVYLDYPPFTPEFLGHYNMACNTEYPEFMIQAFR